MMTISAVSNFVSFALVDLAANGDADVDHLSRASCLKKRDASSISTYLTRRSRYVPRYVA